MLEMKITIAATELAAALNNLACAIDHHAAAHRTDNTTNVAKDEALPTAAPIPPTTPQAPTYQTPVATAPLAHASTPPVSNSAPSIANTPQTATPVEAVPIATPIAQSPIASPTVPTGVPTYTLEMIARAGATLVDAGKMDAVCNLLGKFGVEAITALNPTEYGAFATELRALGAQI